jgi:anti-sigma B factor antagonist
MGEELETPATPAPDFAVDAEVVAKTARVRVQGEVDVYTAPQLRERLYGLVVDGADSVVLDLADMTFIDSTGLGVIVGTLKRLRESGGELTLRSPSRSTRKVLDITGLTRIVTVED